MNKINNARLFYFVPIKDPVTFNRTYEDDFFLELESVLTNEYTNPGQATPLRSCIHKGLLNVESNEYPFKIYYNQFADFEKSFLHIIIDVDSPISLKEFGYLINEDYFTEYYTGRGNTLSELLTLLGIQRKGKSFLYWQLISASPNVPTTYEEVSKYVLKHKNQFHKLLIREVNSPEVLRFYNHSDNFESISNFYGSYDMASPNSVLQIYTHEIESAEKDNNGELVRYHQDRRACWYLALIEVVFLQKFILNESIEVINQNNRLSNKKSLDDITKVEKVLVELQDYWYLDNLTHENSKKLINILKHRMDIPNTLKGILTRVEYTEDSILREISSKQNELDRRLSYILFALAFISLIPLIFDFISDLRNSTGDRLLVWRDSIITSVSIPIIIAISLWFRSRPRKKLGSRRKKDKA